MTCAACSSQARINIDLSREANRQAGRIRALEREIEDLRHRLAACGRAVPRARITIGEDEDRHARDTMRSRAETRRLTRESRHQQLMRVMRDAGEMTVAEIATRLDVSVDYARVILYNSRDFLRSVRNGRSKKYSLREVADA